jgi:hypothetical protein
LRSLAPGRAVEEQATTATLNDSHGPGSGSLKRGISTRRRHRPSWTCLHVRSEDLSMSTIQCCHWVRVSRLNRRTGKEAETFILRSVLRSAKLSLVCACQSGQALSATMKAVPSPQCACLLCSKTLAEHLHLTLCPQKAPTIKLTDRITRLEAFEALVGCTCTADACLWITFSLSLKKNQSYAISM